MKSKQLNARNRSFDLVKRTLVAGILNITPDSFSGDGIFENPAKAISRGLTMIREGADIIDIGGESSRPGAEPLSAEEEFKRIAPVVKGLVELDVPVSVDTYKHEVASGVLELGADLINDIRGLSDPKMVEVISRFKAGVIIMHMKGDPRSMQNNPAYGGGLVEELKEFLSSRIAVAENSGIAAENIIVDPGIGFGKTLDHNLEIIRNLRAFRDLGKPIMIGVSRKSFIGTILGLDVNERLEGTLAAIVASVLNGADIIRVHDVQECSRAIRIADAISKN